MYDASCIQVLSASEAIDQFFWAKADALALQYGKPQEWIERGLEACERTRTPHSYFVDRYLKKLDIPKNEAVNAAMRDLIHEVRLKREPRHPS